MGIFGALTTSVAGLRSQAFALENVSGNIANSQTTAFKRIDTSFLDLIPQTGVNNQLSGSVTTQSRETNTVQGDIQTASKATFMAISGNGFFVTQKPGSFTDNQPVFSGVDNYTRRGDFTIDKNGFLVNGAGYFLEGIPIDPTTGNITGSVPQVLKFANDFIPAQPTTSINYRANLASYPFTTRHDQSVPGSELLRPQTSPSVATRERSARRRRLSPIQARRALRRTIRLRRARGSPPRRCFPAPRQRILSERISQPPTPSLSMARSSPSWLAPQT
jgi:flagellar hook protein FlgE